jgi:hypothetical protein
MIPFRNRSEQPTRIETLSDAVFGFSLTLLVVSLEIPRTYGDLIELAYGFLPFALCFMLCVHIWYLHSRYFRRYGLQDVPTVWLNSILLFLVMFFVYPMKFLVTVVVKALTNERAMSVMPDGTEVWMITWSESDGMIMLFSLGYLAIQSTFVVMYVRAYRMRNELGLNRVEEFDTRTSLGEHGIYASIAVVSIAMAFFGGPSWSPWAGWLYGLQGPIMGVYGWKNGKRREALERM